MSPSRNDWVWYQRLSFGVSRPTSFMCITGVTESGTPEQIMEELREKDPEAHAKLSELVVLGDDGRPTEESIQVLVSMIRGLDA